MRKIGYLGPEGSYSYLAASNMFPESEKVAYASFYLVVKAVLSGDVSGAVLPIENSLNGGVLQNIDLLQSSENLIAIKEHILKLDHRLAYKKGASLKDIKRIFSHRQSLDQCAQFLYANYPEADLISTSSTAASLNLVKSEKDACIVGAHIKREGFELSKENIADEKNNFTHFLYVIKGDFTCFTHSEKIYFSATCRHRPGALVKLLTALEKHSLNMSKIESRPIKEKTGEYRFFIEIEADYAANNVQNALAEIKREANSFKLLGCY